MYASIKYNSALNPNTVLADLSLILTGTTSLGSLSSNVIQEDSVLTTTIAAGWTLFDDVSATVKVFRSPIYDDPTRFKYLWLSAVNGNNIIMDMYSSWNAETHTGTVVDRRDFNGSAANQLLVFNLVTNTESLLLVSASVDHFFAMFKNNNLLSTGSPCGILSHSRMSAWDTTANGYIPAAVTVFNLSGTVFEVALNSPNFFMAFVKDRVPKDATTDYTSQDTSSADRQKRFNHVYTVPTAVANYSAMSGLLNVANIGYMSLGADKVFKPAIYPICIANTYTQPAYYGGECSSLCGIYLSTQNIGKTNDAISIGGTSYRIWVPGETGGTRLAIREA